LPALTVTRHGGSHITTRSCIRLNDGAFKSPEARSLRQLYYEYDVRWLVSDRSAGPVSPLLNGLADLEYANQWIRIYKLDPALLK